MTIEAAVSRMIERQDRERILLRTFFVVHQCGSFRKAADILDLTDATAVRKRIQSLESLLGKVTGVRVMLVMTDNSGHALTAAGQLLIGLLDAEFGG
jgi:DNA-binding transcriptional LysR family regulator